MKRFIFALLLIAIFAHADVKISQLPLGSAASTNVNDSFPYVNSVEAETERLLLSDLINLPAMVATYAPLTSPTFTGTVTAPTIVLSSGATVGYCWTATSSGGAGEWEACSSFSNPMTTLGDIIYGGSSGTPTRLAGNTSATKEFPTQTGTGSASAAPAWGALASGDIPNNAANTTGTASNITATSNSTLTSLSALTSASSLSTVGTIGTGTWEGTTVGISYGGTGQTTANAALNALLPDQSESSGYYLQTDGTNASWVAGSGGGSGVTTVGTFGSQSSAANGAVISGSDIYFQDFTSSNPGMAPASGGGTTNFLRADGSWAAPPGGGGTPGGSSSDVQYNASGSFAGDSSFTYDGSGTVTATTFVGALTGNASTASALASSPTSCSGNDWATGIAADGDASCSQPAFSNLSGQADLISQVTGILPVANGGTGVASVTTSPTASSFAGWDSNSNISANGFGPAYATTATAGSTTTLTAASPQIEDFSGTDAQTIVLPVVSTLPQAGYPFVIGNNSTGLLTVESSGGNVISAVASGQTQTYRAISLTGTTAASWEAPSALGYVAQAQLIGQVVITGCTGAWSTTATSLSAFSAQTGCNYTVTAGNASAPSTEIPGIKFASLPPGNYTLKYEGALQEQYSSAMGIGGYQFWDGTNTANEISYGPESDSELTAGTNAGIQQTISYSSPQPNVTFSIRGLTTSAGSIATIFGQTGSPGVISVYYYPTQSQLVQTPNNSNGNWGGTNNAYSMNATTTSTSFAAVTGSLTGSLTTSGTPQNISCSTYGSGLGETCTLPQTGNYQVCYSGLSINNTNSVVNAAELVDGSGTVIVGPQNGYISTASYGPTFGGCGPYTATSTTPSFQVYGQVSSGTGTYYLTSLSVTSLATSLTGAISPGSVTSSGSGQYHVESANINSGCSVENQSGSWISSTDNPSTGQCALTLSAGEFSSAPTCVASVNNGDGGNAYGTQTYASSATALNIGIANGGTPTNASVYVICMGPH